MTQSGHETDQAHEQAAQEQAGAALTRRGIAQAALVVMAAYVASGVLGLARQVIVGNLFGAAAELDAFVAAARIPELLFNLIAGGALGSAFLPVFTKFLTDEDDEGAWQLAGTVLALLTVASVALAAVMLIAAPWVVDGLLRPGDPPVEQTLTVELLRIQLATVVIFGMSGLLMAVLNAHQHFWRPAFAMSLYNIGIIIGALFLTPLLGIYGLAWGTVLGAIMHLGIQLPELPKIDAHWRPSLDINTPGVREVITLMVPRIVGQAVIQINFVVIAAFTSFMVDGAQTVVTVAFTLMFTTLGVIGQSMGTAVFPSLSAQAAQEDWSGYRRTLGGALRSVLFLAIPVTVGLIVLARPLVTVLFERGAWTADATAGTAWALMFFALGLVGHALLEILARSFYALHDTWTPVLVGVATMALNFILNLILIEVIGVPGSLARGPFAGLALAMTLATALEATTLWLLLRRRIGGLDERRIGALVWRSLLAAVVMGAVILVVRMLFGSGAMLAQLVVGGVVGVAVYFGVALAAGLEEARAIPAAVLRRVGR